MKKIRAEEEATESDRISNLPDDIIHHILSFTNTTKFSVQTSLLSKRWQYIWTTLPYLHLYSSDFSSHSKFSFFLSRLFALRNQDAHIDTVNFISTNTISLEILKRIINYAIAHNVKNLSIETSIPAACSLPLSIFRNHSLKTLKLMRVFSKTQPSVSSRWSLPALRDLRIYGCYLPDLFLNLPALRSLYLNDCELPESFRGLTELTELHLYNVRFSDDKRMHFSEIVNLKSLTLEHCSPRNGVIKVASLRLAYLSVKTYSEEIKFVILAPKLSVFKHSGALLQYVFPLTLCSLHKVHLEMGRWYHYKWEKIEVAVKLISVLQEVQKAKFLTINWNIIEALAKIPDLLGKHSPLDSLTFLMVKENNSEYSSVKNTHSTIPNSVRTYLLGCSPSATIVNDFPQV